MKFKCKTKKIFKNISLGLLGLGAIGAIGVGATKIVEYAKNDLETIHPTFEVGGLGADGKYVKDESTLYTEKAFSTIGLKTTLDFDNEISYQIFYYDILNNYLSCTDVLTDGYSDLAPINGAYARIMIIPTNDEDDKISFTEKYSYAKQLNIEVSKKQNLNEKYTSYKGQCLQVVNNTEDVIFTLNTFFRNGEWEFYTEYGASYGATSTTILNVSNFHSITLDTSISLQGEFKMYQFTDLNMTSYVESNVVSGVNTFDKNTKYVIFTLYNDTQIEQTYINSIVSGLTLSK